MRLNEQLKSLSRTGFDTNTKDKVSVLRLEPRTVVESQRPQAGPGQEASRGPSERRPAGARQRASHRSVHNTVHSAMKAMVDQIVEILMVRPLAP